MTHMEFDSRLVCAAPRNDTDPKTTDAVEVTCPSCAFLMAVLFNSKVSDRAKVDA